MWPVVTASQHITLYTETVSREPVHSFQCSFAEQLMMRTIKDKRQGIRNWLSTHSAYAQMQAQILTRTGTQLAQKEQAMCQGDDKWVEIRWETCDVTCTLGGHKFLSYHFIEIFHLFPLQDERWNVTKEEHKGRWWWQGDTTSFSASINSSLAVCEG